MQIILPSKSQTQSPSIERARMVAQLLDTAFRVPGTRIRFGFDSIIGLIPGIGDVLGMLLGGYIIRVAGEHGVPKIVRMRMMLNLWIDSALGAIPFVGDLMDFGFKAHRKNMQLLEDAIADPVRAKHSGRRALGGLVALSLLGLGVVVFLILWAMGTIRF